MVSYGAGLLAGLVAARAAAAMRKKGSVSFIMGNKIIIILMGLWVK